jgi:hypothetical protein
VPYYLISITLPSGEKIKAIRVHESSNIDIVFRELEAKAHTHYMTNNLKFFDCCLISKQSPYFKAYMKKKNK